MNASKTNKRKVYALTFTFVSCLNGSLKLFKTWHIQTTFKRIVSFDRLSCLNTTQII